MNKQKQGLLSNVDPATTIIPFAIIFVLCLFFVIRPEASTSALTSIRDFLGDSLGLYYLIIGLGTLVISLWISFSDIGKITLGKPGEKPQYGFFTWGAMVFTCGLGSCVLLLISLETDELSCAAGDKLRLATT